MSDRLNYAERCAVVQRVIRDAAPLTPTPITQIHRLHEPRFTSDTDGSTFQVATLAEHANGRLGWYRLRMQQATPTSYDEPPCIVTLAPIPAPAAPHVATPPLQGY